MPFILAFFNKTTATLQKLLQVAFSPEKGQAEVFQTENDFLWIRNKTNCKFEIRRVKGFSHTGKDSVSKLLSDVDPLNGKSFKAERDFKKLLNTFMFNSVELFIAAILCFHLALLSYF